MAAEPIPRIRLVPVPDDALLVVRGGVPGDLLRVDAQRFRRRFPEWGRYGVSGFLAVDHEEIDVLCETRLERFSIVSVFTRVSLQRAGIEIVPTFRRPHVTLANEDVDVLVRAMDTCEHRELSNPYCNGGWQR